MKFSIIIGTLNRHKELQECINCLLQQTYRAFEIIIVDQSQEDFSQITDFDKDLIKYIRIDKKGLSHARNVAISMATGDYICLVDDDGLYDPNVLEVADKIIDEIHPVILGGKMIDPVSGICRSNEGESIINWNSSFKYLVSPTMIIETEFLKIHNFDERFGVGSTYGSGEETDIVLAALKVRKLVYYCDRYIVRHHVEVNGISDVDRVVSYSYGRGALLKKTVKEYSALWGIILYMRSYWYNALSGFFTIRNKNRRNLKLKKASSIRKGFKSFR